MCEVERWLVPFRIWATLIRGFRLDSTLRFLSIKGPRLIRFTLQTLCKESSKRLVLQEGPLITGMSCTGMSWAIDISYYGITLDHIKEKNMKIRRKQSSFVKFDELTQHPFCHAATGRLSPTTSIHLPFSSPVNFASLPPSSLRLRPLHVVIDLRVPKRHLHP